QQFAAAAQRRVGGVGGRSPVRQRIRGEVAVAHVRAGMLAAPGFDPGASQFAGDRLGAEGTGIDMQQVHRGFLRGAVLKRYGVDNRLISPQYRDALFTRGKRSCPPATARCTTSTTCVSSSRWPTTAAFPPPGA